MLPNDPRQTTAEWFARESLAAREADVTFYLDRIIKKELRAKH